MLVVICFLSLSACHVNGSFHQVEFVQARLSPRVRSLSQLIFGVLSLAACLLLAWQFIRLEMSSWRFGDVAPTYLATPLWLPRLPMALGMIALCFSLVPHDRRGSEAMAASRSPAEARCRLSSSS